MGAPSPAEISPRRLVEKRQSCCRFSTIRTAREGEREALSDLHRRSSFVWEENRAGLEAHPDALGVAPAAITAGHVRVAVDPEGRLMGFCIAFAADDQGWELDDLFVEPALMRGGVGRALVEDAARRAAAAGAMTLSVIGHPRARGFYKRVGFEEAGEAVTRFGVGFRMRRRLTSA